MPESLPADDYTVGWVSALPIELAAAIAALDEEHPALQQPPTDTNNYTYGRVGVHNLVAACLAAGHTGTNQAAVVASQMTMSFPRLRFLVLVGIGGGVPSEDDDIRLGDVVISQPSGQHSGVIQYDMGKTIPIEKPLRIGSLNAPPPVVLNALATFRANLNLDRTRIEEHLAVITSWPKFKKPGPEMDTLFIATSQETTERDKRSSAAPVIFFGNIASGNQVMKDAVTRDRISQELGGVLCFEMEAAGMMNNFQCLVIRGICDYADVHKTKIWQPYAAAAAAACAKELLCTIPPVEADNRDQSRKKPHFLVPLGQNRDFVGREDIIRRLFDLVPPVKQPNDCQRIVLEGLGGIGKTQIALQVAYKIRDQYPDCSIFWIPAVTMSTIDNTYRGIANALEIPTNGQDEAKIKAMVNRALSQSSGKWLLVIDNADDSDLVLSNSLNSTPHDLIPFSRNGSILFTTRNHEVTVQLDVPPAQKFVITEMSEAESIELLSRSLGGPQLQDFASTQTLVEFLAYLPLAVKQAAAYMNRTGISTAKYLQYCQQSHETLIQLLSQNFSDRGRYRESANPIAATWLISFQHLEKKNPLAAKCLMLMSFYANKDIPVSLLPTGESELERDEAIGDLAGYAFIVRMQDGKSLDIHRLVQLITRNWFRSQQNRHSTSAVQQILSVYPKPDYDNRPTWIKYMPHADSALRLNGENTLENAQLYALLGESYSLLGNFREQVRMCKKQLEQKRTMLGMQHPDVSAAMFELGMALMLSEKHLQAEEVYYQALKLQRGRIKTDVDMINYFRKMEDLASIYGDQDKLEKSEFLLRFIILHVNGILTLTDLAVIDMVGLFASLSDVDDNQTAEPLYLKFEVQKTLIRRQQGTLTFQMPDIVAILHSDASRPEAKLVVEGVMQQKLQSSLRGSIFGLETIMRHLARCLCKSLKHLDAELIARYDVTCTRKHRGDSHPDTHIALHTLGYVLTMAKKYDEAETVLEDLLSRRRIALGVEHPLTLQTMQRLAESRGWQEKWDEAEQLFEQTLSLRKAVLGEGHPHTLETMLCLASAYFVLGKYREGERIHRRRTELEDISPGNL